MKRLLSLLLPSVAIIFSFAGCNKKDNVETYTYRIYTPVLESKSVIYSTVKSEAPRQLKDPGKIFIKGNYLFISEVDKGIHVYDNSNSKAPQAISFINIPGNADVTVRGNYLYADLYTDLVTLDISDPLHAQVVDTMANFFAHKYYGNTWGLYPDQFIVEVIEKDTTVVINNSYGYGFWESCTTCMMAPAINVGQPKANFSPGISGSMARLVIVNDFLYGVSTSSLISVDLQNPANPERKNESYIFWGIETVYPFNNRLFIGSAEGMFIYNIDNPSEPVREGSFMHVRACDPVVTDGEYAYVTLRSGDECAGNSDQLDVLDVKNVAQPELIKTYPLFNPHGLGKDGNLLFICDGTVGIKVYDATDVKHLELVHHISGVNAYDVIPWRGRLIASTKEGLKQYDYSDVNNIRLLSTIPVAKK